MLQFAGKYLRMVLKVKKIITVEHKRSGIWQDTDITYAQVPGWLGKATMDLKLTILRPFEEQSHPLPVILWFCGGGWMAVDNNIHLPNLVDFVRAGFIIASVDYRNSNQAVWPAQLEDAKAAVRYLKAHADHYQIDVNKIAVMGESAGGHLASMTAVTNGLRNFDVGEYLTQTSNIQAAVSWYGVVDPLSAKNNSKTADFDFVYRNLLGAEPEESPELDAEANPLTFITSKTVPFLILHGTEDKVVPLADDEKLYQALTDKGVPADLYEVKGAAHMDEVFMQPQITDIIIDFLKKHLK